MLREPSVSWLPYFASSPGACTTLTRAQSASISSATIIGRLVRTPVPISARCATMVTMPSGAIETNTLGSINDAVRHGAGAGGVMSGRGAGAGHERRRQHQAAGGHRALQELGAAADVLDDVGPLANCDGSWLRPPSLRPDCRFDPLIAAAAANVARHLLADLLIASASACLQAAPLPA